MRLCVCSFACAKLCAFVYFILLYFLMVMVLLLISCGFVVVVVVVGLVQCKWTNEDTNWFVEKIVGQHLMLQWARKWVRGRQNTTNIPFMGSIGIEIDQTQFTTHTARTVAVIPADSRYIFLRIWIPFTLKIWENHVQHAALNMKHTFTLASSQWLSHFLVFSHSPSSDRIGFVWKFANHIDSIYISFTGDGEDRAIVSLYCLYTYVNFVLEIPMIPICHPKNVRRCKSDVNNTANVRKKFQPTTIKQHVMVLNILI